jgi:hypothetical protein
MIESNARRLEATRVLPFKPLALDFAKLVAERRADRVGAHVRREATNRHADDIQQRVTAENLRNERERIGKALQVGAVPAHILAPVLRRILEGAEDDTGEDLRLRTTLLPTTHTKIQYDTATREIDRPHFDGLEAFSDEEKKLLRAWRKGAPPRDMEALFRVNTKIQARNAGFLRYQKHKRDKAEAKATAAANGLQTVPKAKPALPKPPPRPRVPS